MQQFIIIGWAVCAVLGALVGSNKESTFAGFLLGLLFGPLGVLVAFAVDGRRSCKRCGVRVARIASICPSCGSDLNAKDKPDDSEKDWVERARRRNNLPPPVR